MCIISFIEASLASTIHRNVPHRNMRLKDFIRHPAPYLLVPQHFGRKFHITSVQLIQTKSHQRLSQSVLGEVTIILRRLQFDLGGLPEIIEPLNPTGTADRFKAAFVFNLNRTFAEGAFYSAKFIFNQHRTLSYGALSFSRHRWAPEVRIYILSEY